MTKTVYEIFNGSTLINYILNVFFGWLLDEKYIVYKAITYNNGTLV